MLKMIEAFSYASEYCEVGLWVKASNLGVEEECQLCVRAVSEAGGRRTK